MVLERKFNKQKEDIIRKIKKIKKRDSLRMKEIERGRERGQGGENERKLWMMYYTDKEGIAFRIHGPGEGVC